jgi:hypothetical protein
VRELFIYYRLRPIDAPSALALVRAFQADLRKQHPQLIARLLCRDDEIDGRQTWMEIYSTDPARAPKGVDVETQSAIESCALVLATLVDGPRHTEVFIACVS